MPDDFRTLIQRSADDAPAPSSDLTQQGLGRRMRHQRRRRLLRGAGVAGGALAVAGIAVTLAVSLPGDPESEPPSSQPSPSSSPITDAPAAECVPQIRLEDGTSYSAETMLEAEQLSASLGPHGEAVLGVCNDTNQGGAGVSFDEGTPVKTLRIEGLSPTTALAVEEGQLFVVYLADSLSPVEREQLAAQITKH